MNQPKAPSAADSWVAGVDGTRRSGRAALGYFLLVAMAYLPVLRSDPGRIAADTKTYLFLDPGRLLGRAWSMWDPNIGLGTVSHQTIGYLFPMGPFFWTGDAIGLPDWVAQRLWLGSIIFAAGLGVLFLLRTLGQRGPGVVVAALVFMLSPSLLNYSARISVILLPWAALPWLLALTIRALRNRGWRYPALIAIVVQVVGGVNATALLFVGLAPVLWIPFSIWVVRETSVRRALTVMWRTGALTFLCSLWWIAGLWAQGGYGLNVLRFTETVRAVSRTSLAPEVLRGLGYWFFYGGDKIGPWTESSVPYTQRPLLILVGYSIPTLALVVAAVLRWRYRAYFVLLALVGVAIAVGTHPYSAPSPAGRIFRDFATSSSAGLALRSTGRATPLVVLALAVLLATGINALSRRCSGVVPAGGLVSLGAAVCVAALAVVNLPSLWTGTFYGANLERDAEIPQYWKQAVAALDDRPHGTRILELPGSDFAAYEWGNTVDPITPGLTDRPYVARELIPWGSPASADLVNALDRRIQEGLFEPDALAPVARLLAAGDVVLRNDLQTNRYTLVKARTLWRLFDPPPDGLGEPTVFGIDAAPGPGSTRTDAEVLAAPADETSPPGVVVFPVEDPSEIVRVHDPNRPLILSGDGEGVVDVAAIGLLPGEGRVVLYSATFSGRPAELSAQINRDATLVVTDTNRKRARRWSTVQDNLGETERAEATPLVADESDSRLEVFPDAPSDAYTTVELVGARAIDTSAYGNPVAYTPEDRGVRAFDGDVETAWRVGAFSPVRGEEIRLVLDEAITINRVNLVQPLVGPRERWITEARLSFDGRDAITVALDDSSRTPEGQNIELSPRDFTTLHIEIMATNTGDLDDYGGASPVGFAEVRVADADRGGAPIQVREVLVMPTDLTDVAASPVNALAYTMTRDRTVSRPPRSDPELDLRRRFDVPATRSFDLAGEARLDPAVSDSALDALLGVAGASEAGVTADSSSRLSGDVGARASSAIDGDLTTAWQTAPDLVDDQWIRFQLPSPTTLDGLEMSVYADGRHSIPARLEITTADGTTRTVEVPDVTDGSVENQIATIPLTFEPLSGDAFEITVTATHPRVYDDYRTGNPVVAPVAVAELGAAGIHRVSIPDSFPGVCRDDLIELDGKPQSVRLVGTTAAAERREPLAVVVCEPIGMLDAGEHTLTTARGKDIGVAVDRMVLSSAAGGAAAPVSELSDAESRADDAAVPAVTVTRSGRDRVDVAVTDAEGPFWMVLGQSQNAGWQAELVGPDGTADLGGSTLVDGYANGWLVRRPPGEAAFTIRMRWAPQRAVNAALAISSAAIVAAVAIVIVTGIRSRRRRHLVASAVPGAIPADASVDDALEDLAPSFGRPLAPEASGWFPAIGLAVVSAVVAGFLLQPWAAPILGVVALVFVRCRRVRPVVALFPAVAVAACGFYIALQQYRHRFPPKFEWPTFFGRVNQLAWLAILVIAVTAAAEIIARWVAQGARDPEPTAPRDRDRTHGRRRGPSGPAPQAPGTGPE